LGAFCGLLPQPVNNRVVNKEDAIKI